MTHKTMKMSQLMQHRQGDFSPNKDTWWMKRIWLALHGTWLSVVASSVVCVLASIDCYNKDSYLAASLGIRFSTGIVGCTTAQILYIQRKGTMSEAFRGMAAVAQALEQLENHHILTELERVTSKCRLLQRVVAAYITMVVISILLPTLRTGQLCMPTTPQPEDTPAPGLVFAANLVIQVITGVSCPLAFYSFIGILAVAQMSCASLFRGVGMAVAEARGTAELRTIARLHAQLCEAAKSLDLTTYDRLPMLFVGALALPIQGTYDAVHGQVDGLLLSSAPITVVTFVPLCFLGQAISDESEAVGLQAFMGSWTTEDAHGRFVRIMIIMRTSKPAQFTCKGMGPVNLPACQSVLRSWFSYLQMLINFT